jgi:hypothetical protein
LDCYMTPIFFLPKKQSQIWDISSAGGGRAIDPAANL